MVYLNTRTSLTLSSTKEIAVVNGASKKNLAVKTGCSLSARPRLAVDSSVYRELPLSIERTRQHPSKMDTDRLKPYVPQASVATTRYRSWSHHVTYTVMHLMFQGGHILAKIKFPVFSLCYKNFPCVIFTQKLTLSSMNKGHITTVLLHTEVYKLIF